MSETAPEYHLLAAFVAVADERSFTKAARKLGIGKGTVSRSIATLEEQLGAELVHRTTHAVALSTAGVALYERVAPHLAALDHAVRRLPERAAVPSGELRMTAPQDFGLIVLPQVLALFARRYPEIRVDVRITNVALDLVAEGYDLAIRASGGKLADSALTARRLGQGVAGFFAAPSYLARRGTPRKIGEPGHDWILHSGIRAAIKPLRTVAARFLCDDFLLIRNLAREGAGVGMLPRFVATPFMREGLLEKVELAVRFPERGGVFLVYPSSGQVTRKVTAFRDLLVEWLAKTPLA